MTQAYYGVPFPTPRFTPRGILCGGYTFVWRDVTEEVARESTSVVTQTGQVTRTEEFVKVVRERTYKPVPVSISYVFRGIDESTLEKVEDSVYGKLLLYPATKENVLAFIDLPGVSEDCKSAAWDYHVYFHLLLPKMCFAFLDDKNNAMMTPAPDISPLHHRCVKVKERSRTVTKTLPVLEMVETVKKLPRTALDRAKGRFPTETVFEPTMVMKEQTTIERYVEKTPVYEVWFQYAKTKVPYSQQILSCEYLYRLVSARWELDLCVSGRLALWHDMRVGKTFICTLLIKRLLAESKLDHAIIVAPKGNLYQPWAREFDEEGVSYYVLDGTAAEDVAALRAREHVVFIVNYERLARVTEQIDEGEWDLTRVGLVCDETYAIKNPRSDRAKDYFELASRLDLLFNVGLNGTPGEQGPHDMWSWYHGMDPAGAIWGSTFAQYEAMQLDKHGTHYSIRNELDHQVLIMTSSLRYVRSEADQFSGKDKSYRYIRLPMSKEMKEAGRQISKGVLKDKDGNEEHIKKNILSLYLRFREVCCGYNKFSDDAGGFFRVSHDIDPKLLWVECFLAADPTQALIIFCEFDEQEDRLKLMLDRIGVSWRSTRAMPSKTWRKRLPAQSAVPKWALTELWSKIIAEEGMPGSWDELRYNDRAIEIANQTCSWVLESYECFQRGKKLSSSQRADAIDAFNDGTAQVFILKTDEGRGISLNRKKAVATHKGGRPSIVYLAPTWKLGTWDQSGDRAVDSDAETQKSIHTMVYALVIRGSIEDRMMAALRTKKEVQEVLLKDAERHGYTSFIHDLAEGTSNIEVSSNNEDDSFDSDEMFARITCGVPPTSKLTKSLVYKRLLARVKEDGIQVKGPKDLEEWLATEPHVKANLAVGEDESVSFDADPTHLYWTKVKESLSLLLKRSE